MPILDNAKHEKMVQLKIKGYSQRQAYKEVYDNNMTDEQIDIEASKIFNSPKVSLRYKELMQELEDKSIMSAKDRMKWLTNLINGEDGYISDKLKSIDILNKMSGEYISKIDMNASISYEDAIKEVADTDEY